MKKLITLILTLALLVTAVPFMANAEENVEIKMWTFLDLSSTNGRAIVLGKLIEML